MNQSLINDLISDFIKVNDEKYYLTGKNKLASDFNILNNLVSDINELNELLSDFTE